MHTEFNLRQLLNSLLAHESKSLDLICIYLLAIFLCSQYTVKLNKEQGSFCFQLFMICTKRATDGETVICERSTMSFRY